MYHLNQIPSETNIRAFLKQILFGVHLFCPVCHGFSVVRYERRYRCRTCRVRFSLLSHTWLRDMNISLRSFWLVLWCWTNQLPVRQTEALTSLSEKAIRHWFTLFRMHLPKNQDVLEHIVQLDEAYFGKFGRLALLMGKQIGTRKLAYTILRSDPPGTIDAIRFAKRYLKPETQLNTDASVIYRRIDQFASVRHAVDIHKKFEFTNTSEIEGMFGVLRTFIRRMYHHITEEKLDEYVCEFYFRFCRPELFRSPRAYLEKTLTLVPSG